MLLSAKLQPLPLKYCSAPSSGELRKSKYASGLYMQQTYNDKSADLSI